MTSLTSLTSSQYKQLNDLHLVYDKQTTKLSCSVAAASFLLIGALIIIASGCLCLAIPDIDVIKQVIIPAVLPGLLAIALALPLIIKSVKLSEQTRRMRKQTIVTLITHLESYNVAYLKKSKRIQFILKNILNWRLDPNNPKELIFNRNWSAEYQQKILTDIKKKIGNSTSERNPAQEKIATAIDGALPHLQSQKFKLKKRATP